MNSNNLIDLRTTLTNLYPDELSIRRISDDAGIDTSRIALGTNAQNTWYSILSEAEKNGQTHALLDVVEHEYRGNKEFQNAANGYRRLNPRQYSRPGQFIFENSDELSPLYRPHATLIVSEQADRALTYNIISVHPIKAVACVHIPAHKVSGSTQFSLRLHEILQSCGQLDQLTTLELRCVWLQLEGLGVELYDTFVVDALRTLSATWPDQAVVSIETDEQWIPWELIYDGKDFWGKKFIIARKPTIPDLVGLQPVQRSAGHKKRMRLKKVVNVIGGGLGQSTAQTIRHLFTQIENEVEVKHCEESKAKQLNVAEIADEVNQADLIHFTCHAHGEPPYLQLGATNHMRLAALNRLQLGTIRRLGDISQSIVFVNACSSSAPAAFLGQTRTFGWQFYCKGVDAYIGTLGLIPAEYAVTFAEYFYQQLLKGSTIGEALQYAKRQPSVNPADAQGNPFWLLYCLYGDPFTRKLLATTDASNEA